MHKLALGVIIAAAAVVVVGCAPTAPTEPAPAPSTPTIEPAVPDTPSPEPTEDQASAAGTSPRGNLIKRVGEVFGFGDSIDALDASFVVTSITVDPGCTGEFAESPENGHFVRIDIEGETSSAFADQMYFSGTWKVIAENGTTFNGNPDSLAAWSCLADAEMIPSVVGPGERVAGSMVLDVPTASGVIVLDMTGQGGWEWEYPQS